MLLGIQRTRTRTCTWNRTKPDLSEDWLKVVGNQKVVGSGMCQSVPFCLRLQRSMFFSVSILLLSLILSISVSAPVKKNE
jgi:hypothetical protein